MLEVMQIFRTPLPYYIKMQEILFNDFKYSILVRKIMHNKYIQSIYLSYCWDRCCIWGGKWRLWWGWWGWAAPNGRCCNRGCKWCWGWCIAGCSLLIGCDWLGTWLIGSCGADDMVGSEDDVPLDEPWFTVASGCCGGREWRNSGWVETKCTNIDFTIRSLKRVCKTCSEQPWFKILKRMYKNIYQMNTEI